MREPKRDTPYFRWGLTLFCSLSAVILVYVLLTRMSGVMGFVQTLWKTLSPVVYGLAIAYLLCYPMNFFEGLLLRAFHLPAYDPLVTEEKPAAKRRKLCRGLAVLITFILVGLLIWAFIAMLLPRLVQSITQLISSTDDYYQTVEGWVTRILEKNPELVDYATGFLGRFETYLTQFFTGTIAPRVQRLLTTLTYSVIGVVKSTFNIIVGQSAKKTNGNYYLGGSAYHMKDMSRPYISYTDALQEEGEMSIYGGKNPNATLASYFARFSYNYAERYMLQATVRRDGSSRFGSNNHWATFPSFSLGWNLHNEPYLNIPEWLSTSKVRFSWGKNGNENIGNFGYTVLTATGNNYLFGSGENMTNGVKASGLANPSLRWEESTQTDVGVDFGFFDNALTFTVDYYNKITDGMLMTMNIPSYVGESKPIGNVGKMQNSGVEMEAMYRISAGDWNFRLGGNMTYLKNVLIEYGNDSGWANYDSFQGVGTVSRAENGYPFPFFYGLQTDGVYQTAFEAANGPTWSDGTHPVAGDVRFRDISGPDGRPDGIIDDNDRTYIGKGMPDWTYGINLQASYKGFDLSAVAQGVWGCQIFDATRRTDISTVNLPSYMLGRWTGEGTSNRLPRFALGDNHNWVSSDLYVYDGSYFRLKNVQLGYTLPKRLTQKAFIDNFRVYVAGENLVTFTKYHGYDPEIASGGTSLGIDRGVYPQARTLSIGANITFGTKGDKPVAPVIKYVESEPVIKEVIKEVCRDAPAKGSNPIDDNLYFVIGSSELEAGQAFKLGRLYQVLLENPDMKIAVYGSADSATGTPEINKRLSEARAKVVKDKLIEAGIKADRISTAAFIDNNIDASPEENRVAVCFVN